MDRKQLMSLFIIFIIGSSTAAYVLLYAPQYQGVHQTPTDPGIVSPQTPTAVPVIVESVNGFVVQILPTLVFSGETQEAQLDRIEGELSAIPGILSLTGTFQSTQGPDGALILVYVGSVRYDMETHSPTEIADAITAQTTHLTALNFAQQGIAELPPSLPFENTTLGITQVETLSNPQVQAIFDLLTLQGDEVELTAVADLSGDLISNVRAFEVQNLTAAGNNITIVQDFEIASLLPELTFSGTFPLRNASDMESLKAVLENVAGVEQVHLDYFVVESPLARFILTADYNALLPELEQGVRDLNGVTEVTRNEEGTDVPNAEHELLVELDPNADLISLLETIESVLLAAGVSENHLEVVDPNTTVLGTVVVASSTLPTSLDRTQEQMNVLNFSGSSYQIASFTLDLFVAPLTNEIYTIPDGMFLGGVTPGKKIGDPVELEIFFNGARGIANPPIQARET